MQQKQIKLLVEPWIEGWHGIWKYVGKNWHLKCNYKFSYFDSLNEQSQQWKIFKILKLINSCKPKIHKVVELIQASTYHYQLAKFAKVE
jgi:hypothetical protein